MKDADHIALAKFLSQEIFPLPTRRHERAFLAGNLLPDYNLFTYLRRFYEDFSITGHNENKSKYIIKRIMTRLEKNGVKSVSDSYALGALTHYLADSFTYVHTEDFHGSAGEHRRYEWSLHRCFVSYPKQKILIPFESAVAFWKAEKQHYQALPASCEKDCKFILETCCNLYLHLMVSKNK